MVQSRAQHILIIASLALLFACTPAAEAATRKAQGVFLGAVHYELYSQQGDPAGFRAGETSLPVRALIVDGKLKE